MFLKRNFKTSLIAIAVSTSLYAADAPIVNESFDSAIEDAAALFQGKIDDNNQTIVKIQDLQINGMTIPLGEIWTNELLNELNNEYREISIQPLNMQQLMGQTSSREWEDNYRLASSVTVGAEELIIAVQLIDIDRESVIGTKTITIPKSPELAPLIMPESGSGIAINDFYEPDDASSPNELVIGVAAEGHTIGGESDEDWFTFTTGDDGEMITAYTSSSLDTKIFLYSDDTSYSIDSNDDGGEDSNARLSFLAEPNTTYFLKVEGYGSDDVGSYTLHTSAETYVMPEDEPNNNSSDAVEIPFGEEYQSGLMPGSDVDWYKITAPDSPQLITIQTLSGMDTQLEVFGPNSSSISIGSDDDGGNDSNAKLMFPSEPDAVYYIKVEGYDGDNVRPYKLGMNSESYEIPEDEPNNSFDSAIQLDFGDEYESGLMPSTDVDYFRIELPQNIESSSSVSFQTTGGLDTQIELYDDDHIFLTENDDSGEENNALASTMAGDNEHIFVKVTGYDSEDVGTYSLVHSITETTDISFGEKFTGRFSSENGIAIFKLEIPEDVEGSQLIVETRGYLDTQMSITNDNGRDLGSNDDDGDDENARLSVHVSAGDVLFIEVSPYDSDNYGQFELVHNIQ